MTSQPDCDHIRLLFFFFNDTATTEIYTLSLHDALPICLPSPPAPPRPLVRCHASTDPNRCGARRRRASQRARNDRRREPSQSGRQTVRGAYLSREATNTAWWRPAEHQSDESASTFLRKGNVSADLAAALFAITRLSPGRNPTPA